MGRIEGDSREAGGGGEGNREFGGGERGSRESSGGGEEGNRGREGRGDTSRGAKVAGGRHKHATHNSCISSVSRNPPQHFFHILYI